jgi:hypothetical protein
MTTTFAAVQKHPRYRVSVPVAVTTQAGATEQLRIEDISLGGVFIRTTLPSPPGSFVAVRLPLGDPEHPFALMGRVVHVIDGAASVEKARAPGMGVQFDGLSPQHERLLRSFVDGLVDEERRLRERRDGARFIDLAHVELTTDREQLRRLWTEGLARGEIYAHGEGKRGNRVSVAVGPLTLAADVVRVDERGALLHIADLQRAGPNRDKLDALAKYVEGTSTRLTAPDKPAVDDGMVQALADARRLYRCVDDGDNHAALALDDDAGPYEIQERARELIARFTTKYASISAPQRARLDDAARLVRDIEAALLAAYRKSREGAPVPVVDATTSQTLGELVAEAEFLASVGKRDEAHQALLDALALVPENEEVLELVRRAVKLSSSRDLLVRALPMLAAAGAVDDAVVAADTLMSIDGESAATLAICFDVLEGRARWATAAKAGEALLRLRPDDVDLRERVVQVVALARIPSRNER